MCIIDINKGQVLEGDKMISISEELRKEEFSYLPQRIRGFLRFLKEDQIEEIRLRANRPLSVRTREGRYFVTYGARLSKNRVNTVSITREDIEEGVSLLCASSVYAHEEEIKKGFITTEEGHRVGLCGEAVISNNEISFIKNISGLNYRIAHEIKGAADGVMRDIIREGKVLNTLIISPPGAGKTTLLRDIARKLSDRGKNVSILDERDEIAAMNGGISGFDVGVFTDVLSGCAKSEGIEMLIRSMSPEVIITDELGGVEDFSAVKTANTKGVSVIATAHGENVKDFSDMDISFFKCIIVLSNRLGAGTIEEIMVR